MTQQPDQTKNQRAVAFAQSVIALQASNPQAWAVFMTGLADRIDEATEACIANPEQHQTVILKGRAQEARDIFKKIDGARALLESLHAKEQNNGNRTSR